MKLTTIFARNLRRYRKEADLTQGRLGEFAGLDRNYIGKLEREENSPTLEAVEALALALQINAEELIRRDLPERLKSGFGESQVGRSSH